MLGLIDLEGKNLTQRFVSGRKVDQLCRSENLKVVEEAYACDDSWKLSFYFRKNLVNFEAGIILLPVSIRQRGNPNLKEMLRVFARGSRYRLCLDVVTTYYVELRELHNLQKAAKAFWGFNARPNSRALQGCGAFYFKKFLIKFFSFFWTLDPVDSFVSLKPCHLAFYKMFRFLLYFILHFLIIYFAL